MSSILITGMTSAQCSPKTHARSATFAGLLRAALQEIDHDVYLKDPEVWWDLSDLKQYDAVFVGLAPLTSMSANRAYAALNVIDTLWRRPDKKQPIYFYLDAPEPARVWAGLRAVNAHPDKFTKTFFSAWRGYELAIEPATRKRLLLTAQALLKKEWPLVLWPRLPWHQPFTRLKGQLPENALRRVMGLNLDRWLNDPMQYVTDKCHDRWAVERGHEVWTRGMNLTWPTVDLSTASKASGDKGVFHAIQHSAGTLVPPYRDGTWWTPRISQSLMCQIPVASEWRETQALSETWSTLATTIEGMNFEERLDVADTQRLVYDAWLRENTPDKKKLNRIFKLRSWERV